jgi:membrane-associated phospholipid phosphatase
LTPQPGHDVLEASRQRELARAELPALRTDPRAWLSMFFRRPWTVIRRPSWVRPYLLGELLVILLLLKVYDLVRGQAEVRRGAALDHGDQIMRLESTLRMQIEPAVNRWVAEHHALSLAASYWYQFAHLTITLSLLAWCWWRRPQIYRSARNALVIINAVGLVVFFLYPVAPPRLLPHFHFIDSVAQAGFGTSHGGPVTADQYGAFPSLHIGWAVWTAILGYRMARSNRLGWIWFGYPFITCFVIVATGNHYLLDAVGGAVLALMSTGAVWFAGRLKFVVARRQGRHDMLEDADGVERREESGEPRPYRSAAKMSEDERGRREDDAVVPTVGAAEPPRAMNHSVPNTSR